MEPTDKITYTKSIAPLTTLGVGGFAHAYVQVTDDQDFLPVCTFAQREQLPIFPLGGGSNTLALEAGYQGLLLHVCTKGIHLEDVSRTLSRLTVAAGELLDDTVAYAVERGLWGLENFSHIPGTTGAAPVQNVGAYGVEMKDVIEYVTVFDMHTYTFKQFTREACLFAYRDSVFKTKEGKRYIITSVTFLLSKAAAPKIMYKDLQAFFAADNALPTLPQIRAAIIQIRSEKFPNWHEVGTAGSFFKNPIITKTHFETLKSKYPDLPGFSMGEHEIKVSLGYILDKILGLRGYTEGKVRLFEKQALVLVAQRGAQSSEVQSFARKIISKVFDATQIQVEMEVTLLESRK